MAVSLAALLLPLLAALVQPSPAPAAFRGSNGSIAYSAGGSIRTVDPGDRSRARVARAGSSAQPAFSPLGLRVAFSRRAGSGRDLWIANADGSGLRRLTSSPVAVHAEPAWSPGGGSLAWTRTVRGDRDIYTLNADGSGQRRVTAGPQDDYAPAWSGKGKIAFARRVEGNQEIYTVRPDGQGLRQITRRSASDTDPSWSPDSSMIAFVRRGEVHTVKLRTGAVRRLTSSGGASPTWSPDGERIALSRGRAGAREIFVINANGRGRLRRLTAERTDAGDPDWQSGGHDPVIAAAGDIACDAASIYFNRGVGTRGSCRQRDTSNLLLNMDLDKVLALGDVQYSEGTLGQFRRSYNPSWGRLKSITAPSVGNHEYRTPNAKGYFDYFNGVGNATGPAGKRGEGYYSYDVGDSWHVVVLNSNCGYPLESVNVPGGCDAGSPQETWLRADLAQSTRPCTLAYWHHPRFRGDVDPTSTAFWSALYDANADLVLNGHLHNYQRSAPRSPSGDVDRARGIRQIIVGTGGKSHAASTPAPGNEVNHSGAYGVVRVTLRPRSYRWEFVPVPGRTFTDSGAERCH